MLNSLLQRFLDWKRENLLGGANRSPKWAKIRKEYLKENPLCAVCGKRGTIFSPNQIHHLEMFSKNPSRELDPTNLITLCPREHLIFGHLCDWHFSNKNCKIDCEIWRQKILNKSK